MAIYVFSEWRKAAILDLQSMWNLKVFLFLGRFCLWTKFRMNVCSRHLEFCRSEIWRQEKSRLAGVYLPTKFGEDVLKGGRVMTIYVFLKWQPAAILDFQISEIWRYFFFEDVGFSLWAKFCVNICNRAWGMAIKKWIFKKLVNLSKWNLTSGKVAAGRCLSPYQIWWRYLEGRPSYDDLCVFKTVDDPPLRYRHLNFPRWRPSSYLGFGETGNSAIRSADLENPILEPNTE